LFYRWKWFFRSQSHQTRKLGKSEISRTCKHWEFQMHYSNNS